MTAGYSTISSIFISVGADRAGVWDSAGTAVITVLGGAVGMALDGGDGMIRGGEIVGTRDGIPDGDTRIGTIRIGVDIIPIGGRLLLIGREIHVPITVPAPLAQDREMYDREAVLVRITIQDVQTHALI